VRNRNRLQKIKNIENGGLVDCCIPSFHTRRSRKEEIELYQHSPIVTLSLKGKTRKQGQKAEGMRNTHTNLEMKSVKKKKNQPGKEKRRSQQ